MYLGKSIPSLYHSSTDSLLNLFNDSRFASNRVGLSSTRETAFRCSVATKDDTHQSKCYAGSMFDDASFISFPTEDGFHQKVKLDQAVLITLCIYSLPEAYSLRLYHFIIMSPCEFSLVSKSRMEDIGKRGLSDYIFEPKISHTNLIGMQ